MRALSTLFCICFQIGLNAQNMGVKLTGGALPNTTLDVNGSIGFREGAALTLSNETNNDIVLSDYTFYRITGPTASFDITGFANGVDGRILIISNVSDQKMTIKNEVTSTAANQIMNGGRDLLLSGSGAATLMYNSTLQRWLVICTRGEITSASEQIIIKSANETVSNSTTLQDDDHFTFSVGTNETWIVDGLLYVDDGAAGGGMKMAFDSGTGTEKIDVINFKGSGLSNGKHTIFLNSAATDTYNFDTDNTNSIHIKGVITGPSSGSATFKMRWAQSSANPTATTVRQNSFMKFMRAN